MPGLLDNRKQGSPVLLGAARNTHTPGLLGDMDVVDKATLAVSPVPLLGDVAGAANDIRHFVEDPETITPGNVAASAIGLLPGVPPLLGMVKKPSRVAKEAVQSDRAVDFAKRNWEDKTLRNEKFEIGPINNADRVKRDAGADLAGKVRKLDTDFIRHTLNRHGVGKERDKKNIPLTLEDFGHVAEVLRNPDNIIPGKKSGKGLQTVVYEKRVNGHILVVEEIRTGKGELVPTSMTKRPVAKLRAKP